MCEDDKITSIEFDNIEFIVIGPNKKRLEDLNADWLKWIKNKCPSVKRGVEEKLALEADKSKPNLSSIMFLAKSRKGKSILFTGDGLEEHIIKGLENANLMDENGRIEIDVLKVPHHGSYRNVSYCFFRTVRAKAYVLSGDGSHGNPELLTLKWIVEAAMEQKREITIYITNETTNVKRLKEIYKPEECGYVLQILSDNEISKVINLHD